MADLRLSVRALDDLRSIDAYLAERNPEAARRVIGSIRHTLDLLSDFPHLGPKSRHGNLRYCLEPRYQYLIYYRTDGAVIDVLYILHPRRSRPPA
ncbi:type II toxin-antitoxin system RelE/ParE family toxin [Psychromarinibacter sp. C21-152]|uniref:Type II toxin-antitoxin system RelE/ParE family toxin n=1 Tax=Psychromarinibacter sediminicola TaxID=3033385 RepID=A0AAE3TA04_9RHOB|nr:type II toxin-antitoxin system RelE/ParE family toxin [Psychromarinibacter sediminicola]MDF0601509.1 type II toxin-antitoxin system RelE/ParE family toxin [Psychromarinibacter sediminicola]